MLEVKKNIILADGVEINTQVNRKRGERHSEEGILLSHTSLKKGGEK